MLPKSRRVSATLRAPLLGASCDALVRAQIACFMRRDTGPRRPLACLPACLVPARLPVCPPALLLPSSCTAAILSTGSTSGVSNLVLPIFCCCSSAILDTRHAATPCSLPSQPCCLTGLDNSRATCDAYTPCPAPPCAALAALVALPAAIATWDLGLPTCKVPSEAFAAGCGGTLGLRWPGSRPGRQARYRTTTNSIPTPALERAPCTNTLLCPQDGDSIHVHCCSSCAPCSTAHPPVKWPPTRRAVMRTACRRRTGFQPWTPSWRMKWGQPHRTQRRTGYGQRRYCQRRRPESAALGPHCCCS
jgi:hypothetical protein